MNPEATVAMTSYEPVYLLAPRAEGYAEGDIVYLDIEDERVRVTAAFEDGTAEARRLTDDQLVA